MYIKFNFNKCNFCKKAVTELGARLVGVPGFLMVNCKNSCEFLPPVRNLFERLFFCVLLRCICPNFKGKTTWAL